MNSKVIFVNLPPAQDFEYSNVGSIYPATGILLTGSIMKHQGLRVKVIDGAIHQDYEEKVLAAIGEDTAMVCFSVMTSQGPMALKLSETIKGKGAKVLIVWGGIHAILFPRQTVENKNVDIVITGDGIVTTSELVDYIKGRNSLEQVKGIGYKNSAGKPVFTAQAEPDDINMVSHFDFGILDDPEVYLKAKSVYAREIATDNNEKVRLMPILTALGCCYKCNFCINVFLKRKYRFRPAQSIIDEIKRLQKEYGANAFILLDEDFPISKKRLIEFLDLIEKENLKFYWRIWGRVSYFRENYINEELVSRLERCGLRSIAMGAESGSQKILDMIKKQIKVQDILRSVKSLAGTKITARYSFIVGLENELREDTLATYALCADLIDVNPRVDIAGPFIFRYYPGSPIFDNIVRQYNVSLPQTLDQWSKYLSAEGFLKMEEMPWLWPDFERTVANLNKYIDIYAARKSSRRYIWKLVRRLINWRIKNSCLKFPYELYVFDSYLALRRFAKLIRNRFYTRGVAYEKNR